MKIMYNIGKCSECTTCGSCQQMPNADTPILFCMHCKASEAPCLLICKQEAIFILGRAISLDYNKCNQCRDCVEVCPINIIKI